MTLSGLPLTQDAETRRLRRYETEARREWHRALDELLTHQANRKLVGPVASPWSPPPEVPSPEPPVVANVAKEDHSVIKNDHAIIKKAQPEAARTVKPEPVKPKGNRRYRREQKRKSRLEARKTLVEAGSNPRADLEPRPPGH